MAYKQPGWSAFTQKSKSGDKDEDRQLTLNEIEQQRADRYTNVMDSMSNEQALGNLRKGEWDLKNQEEFNKMNTLNKASLDSIQNVQNIEDKKINDARRQALQDYNDGKITMNEAKKRGVTFE